MKKVLSILLSFSILLSVCGMCFLSFADAPCEGVCGETAQYSFDSETKTLIVSGTGEIFDYNYSSRVSPFLGLDGMEKLVIDGGITGIGKHAFEGCENLEKAELPDSLRNIKNYAFKGCTALKVIKIPDSVKTIGEGAFSDCTNLSKAVFGKSVNCIGKNAFYGCKNLKTVKLNKKLKKILPFAFFNCRNVRKVYIPKSVKKIGSGAFGMYYKGKGKKSKLCRVKKFVITSGGSVASKQYAKDYGFKYKKVKGV